MDELKTGLGALFTAKELGKGLRALYSIDELNVGLVSSIPCIRTPNSIHGHHTAGCRDLTTRFE